MLKPHNRLRHTDLHKPRTAFWFSLCCRPRTRQTRASTTHALLHFRARHAAARTAAAHPRSEHSRLPCCTLQQSAIAGACARSASARPPALRSPPTAARLTSCTTPMRADGQTATAAAAAAAFRRTRPPVLPGAWAQLRHAELRSQLARRPSTLVPAYQRPQGLSTSHAACSPRVRR